ncbi:MAG: type III PLP-dependent enzyme [Bryobacteraceae bacterium]
MNRSFPTGRTCHTGHTIEAREPKEPATPYLTMNLDGVEAASREFHRCFPGARVHYAVKANPAPEVVAVLARSGCRFDVASPAEVDICLGAGALAEELSYGNTIKKSRDIAYAYRMGVRLFAFDCEEELEKLARHAPGAKVFCRLAVESTGSCWPLARKFGCGVEMAERLLMRAVERGMLPWGVSFHVGSQQTDPGAWEGPIAMTGRLFRRLRERGAPLSMVNLGGGFPAHYAGPAPELSEYAARIEAALREHVAEFEPEVLLEPGRGLVGDAGTIRTEVVLVSHRNPEEPRWVYVDAGKFGGLAETMDECIQYRIRPEGGHGGAEGPVILAGPTCDSADILYERTPYSLPLDLREGDRLEILSAGAYTSSYSSVGFNGFGPLATYFV